MGWMSVGEETNSRCTLLGPVSSQAGSPELSESASHCLPAPSHPYRSRRASKELSGKCRTFGSCVGTTLCTSGPWHHAFTNKGSGLPCRLMWSHRASGCPRSRQSLESCEGERTMPWAKGWLCRDLTLTVRGPKHQHRFKQVDSSAQGSCWGDPCAVLTPSAGEHIASGAKRTSNPTLPCTRSSSTQAPSLGVGCCIFVK